MEDKQNPLVSVAVITYNSSKTVVETLDSIYNQTYQNMELIISDDCSTDDTIDVCRRWLEQHKDRFVHTEIITVPKNTGVAANNNRAIDACSAEWIKPIAGDDILLPECIYTYSQYISLHKEAVWVFSKCETFGGSLKNREWVDAQFNYEFFGLTAHEQYVYLVETGNCIPASTGILNKTALIALKLKFDEKIPLLEDWPMWIKLTQNGIHLDFIDKKMVKYRVSELSLSTTENMSKAYLDSCNKVFIYYQFPYLYRHGNKKEAVLRYLGCKKNISNFKLFWEFVIILYKIIFYPEKVKKYIIRCVEG